MRINILNKVICIVIAMYVSLFLYEGHIEATGIDSGEEQVVHISPKNVNSSKNDTVVTGEIPQVRFIKFDPQVEQTINTEIEKKFNQRVELAKLSNAKSVFFEYEVIQDGAIFSFLIKSTAISQGSQRNDVDSVSINTSSKRIIYINDILGSNGVKIVSKYIKAEIAKDPKKYRSDFTGITNTHDFYVKKDKLYILFDKNEIAVSTEGIASFEFDASNIINYTMTYSEYKVKTDSYNLKMIPLRIVAEVFDYSITWYGSTKTIDIRRHDLLSSIKIGDNSYFANTSPKRPLEVAPELINGVTYVPISFIEEYLSIDYFVNNDGTITFSKYKNNTAVKR